MVKAVFLDFYGTVVHEDGEIIKVINQKIYNSGKVEKKSDIGSFWWNEFQTMCKNSYGENFRTQRDLEIQSLAKTINHFSSTEDAKKLSDLMFEHWMYPPIFEESKQFFNECTVPIYMVSNIDRCDIDCALAYHELKPKDVFTSEDAKSYKPRKELFELALKNTNLKSEQVVHIGDSISSDILGASALGINTLWLNRSDKEVPADVISISNLMEAFKTENFTN